MREYQFPDLRESYFETVLPSGLRIRVIPRADFAKTFSFFAANYGSIDLRYRLDGRAVETPAGVAHYLEHKMFDMPDGSVMAEFSRLGGSPNAFTGYTTTAYHVESTDRWADNLRLLLRFVSTPYFTEESVEKERGIIAQEIRMYEDNPDTRMYENLFSILYDHHPVRVPISGTVESIEAISARTLHECYCAFYRPSNMMLCVAGPVDPEAVAEIAREVLPPSGGEAPARDYGPPEALTGHRGSIRQAMEVSMPCFTLAFKCPPAEGQAALRQELLGDLAAEVLVGESTALYTRLYEDGLISSDFSAGYESVRELGLLSASGDSKDPELVAEAILDRAAAIAREGVDEALFQRLKRAAFGRRMRELDSLENICYRMCESCFQGAEYYDFPALYRGISSGDAAELIADAVTAPRSACSVIYPTKKV